ncbi:hypothetical protein D3C86_1811080 [compost metagenome]
MQTALDIGITQHFNRDQNGYLPVAGDADHGQATGQCCQDHGASGVHQFKQCVDNHFQCTTQCQRACKRKGTKADQQRAHHGIHATAVQQITQYRVDILITHHRHVKAVDCAFDDIMKGKSLNK